MAKTRHILGLARKRFHNSRLCPSLAALGVALGVSKTGWGPEVFTSQLLLLCGSSALCLGPQLPSSDLPFLLAMEYLPFCHYAASSTSHPFIQWYGYLFSLLFLSQNINSMPPTFFGQDWSAVEPPQRLNEEKSNSSILP